MTNGEKHIERLLSWYKEAVTENGVCYLTCDDKNTLAYALKCCKHYEDTKKDIDTWMLREEPSSSEKPNKSEIPTGSIEIKVGDEVTVEGVNGIVVREPYPIGSDNELFVLVWYGQNMSSNSLKNVIPTGRHFSQITEVLEQLRRSCCGGLE